MTAKIVPKKTIRGHHELSLILIGNIGTAWNIIKEVKNESFDDDNRHEGLNFDSDSEDNYESSIVKGYRRVRWDKNMFI